MKTELINKMAEIAQGADFDYEKVNEELFEELVPASGNAPTLAGEILRAVNRIEYRYWNDGDIAGIGYGRETVNPAVRFLNAMTEGAEKCPFKVRVAKFKKYVDLGYSGLDSGYEAATKALTKSAIEYIANNKLWEQSNEEDMWDYKDDEYDVDNDWEDEE